MPVEVILPKVDMDMSHGTIAVWHVAEGEAVARGAALFDIETDKAAMEVEAPAAGRLARVTAQPGDRVAVGTVVALILAEGEALAATPAPQDHAAVAAPAPAPGPRDLRAEPRLTGETAPETASEARPAPQPGRPRATPAARTAARAAGLSIDAITGSGPRGRVQRDDVAAEAVRAEGAPFGTSPAVLPALAPGWSPEPGPLHLTMRKGPGTPLLMMHGFTADSQSWAPLERTLPPDLPLVRIDLPGHGRSPRRRIAGFADLSRMLVEAVDTLLPDGEPLHVLGHSLGGALAIALADVRPRRVTSLTLIAPAGLGPEIDAAALGGILRATRADSLGPWLRRLAATPDGISDDYARAAMKLRADPALRAAQADMADQLFPDGVQAFDLRPALQRLTCPTAVIWGRQDHILPYAQGLAAQGDFARHLLSGAGHIPQFECPDRVARVVARQVGAGL
jgi:pyruvate dehydrogenase E2 component (dihydrolipoamide acetyltransferase)